MRHSRFSVALVVLLLSTAWLAAEEYLIPAVARTEGAAGASWRTSARILNAGSEPVQVAATLQPWQGGPTSTTISLDPGHMGWWDDLVDELFGLGQGAGPVRLTATGPLLVSSRTYNQATSGTYGQLIPGFDLADAHQEGDTVYLIGMVENAAFRSNLGLLNLEPSAIAVSLTIHAGDGSELLSWVEELAPDTSRQLNGVLAAHDLAPIDSAWAVLSADGTFFSYLSVVDNGTNDPVFRAGMTGNHDNRLVIPASARGPGAEGTLWATDLMALNPNPEPAAVSVALWPRGIQVSSPSRRRATLGPAAQLQVEDALAELFAVDQGAAALSFDHADGVLIDSRTYSTGAGGSFGQHLPALSADDALVSGEVGYLLLAAESPELRTNLILVNLAAATGGVRVSAHQADGLLLGEQTWDVPARTYLQVNRVLQSLADGTVEVSYLALAVESTAAQILAGGSTIDNQSGDATFEVARREAVEQPALWLDAGVGSELICPGATTTLYWSAVNAVTVLVNGSEVADGCGATTVEAGDWTVEAVSADHRVSRSGSVEEHACDQAACESLYAAAVAEMAGCACDTVFADDQECRLPSSLATDTTLCRDDESANACARRLYDGAEEAVGLQPWVAAPDRYVASYLPRCQDGSDGPCPGSEVRCYDGTRPLVYALKAHADEAHTPMTSDVWVISMGGEGGPCGGEVSTVNPLSCWWPYFHVGGPFRESLTTKSPWAGPARFRANRGGIHSDQPRVNDQDDPFHHANRVFFERCGEYASRGEEVIHPTFDGISSVAGPTTVYHHGRATTVTLFNFLTTVAGRDLGDGDGGPPDGDADDAEDLPSLADAGLILLTGSSDAGKWLIHSADALAAELATIAPGAEVKVVFDSILPPILEHEHQARYPFDADLDRNGNGVNDIYDHIVSNPSLYQVPHADPDDPPYGAAVAYGLGGRQRLGLEYQMIEIDASCAATHADDLSPCYDTYHLALNHVAVPFAIIMDQSDVDVRTSSWTATANDWRDADYIPRVRALGIDMARWSGLHAGCGDPTIPSYTPLLWMANRRLHTHLLIGTRRADLMYRCDETATPVEVYDLNTALAEWLAGVTTLDAISEYQRDDGTTWHDRLSCGD